MPVPDAFESDGDADSKALNFRLFSAPSSTYGSDFVMANRRIHHCRVRVNEVPLRLYDEGKGSGCGLCPTRYDGFDRQPHLCA